MATTSDWQKKIDGVLMALRRLELHLGNQNDYQKVQELQHRRQRILSRYRPDTTGVFNA